MGRRMQASMLAAALASACGGGPVTGHQIVSAKDTWIVNPTPTATITIFACHPKHSAAQRYVVHGDLVASGPPS